MTTISPVKKSAGGRPRTSKRKRPGHPGHVRHPARAKKSDHFLQPNLKTQAGRVIARFGGACDLWRALHAVGVKRDLAVVYRWDKPKSKGGTGGTIPAASLPHVMKAARMAGVLLTEKDLSPLETK